MDVIRVHQILSYLVSLCGATCLYFAEPEDTPPYPIVAMILALLAHELCDRRRRFFIPKILSDLLTVTLVVAIFVKFTGITLTFLTDLGRLLIYMQIIRWFRPKSIGDYWSLYSLSLLQVGIACTVNKTQAFGAMVVVYVGLAMLAMTMFVIRQHGALSSFASTRAVPKPPPLILRGLTWGRLGSLMALLFICGAVFAYPIFRLMPRVQVDVGQINVRGDTGGITTIGYSEEVRLDETSKTVVNNEDVVLEIRANDANGKPTTIPGEMLWRGSVFNDYAGPNWVPPNNNFAGPQPMSDSRTVKDDEIELVIERKGRLRELVFCPLGLHWVKHESAESLIDFYPWYQLVRINRSSTPRRRNNYIMHVASDFGSKKFKNPSPHSSEYLARVTSVSNSLTRLNKLVEELMKDIPKNETQKRIDRLMAYLMTDGELSYMIEHEPGEQGVDPIEDFLFRKKRGNCEYFASALALMLRSAGVPSRLVNGFKGADYYESGKYYQVRQLHAHSWVEAYFTDRAEWVTLDPTPGDARDQQLEAARTSSNIFQRAYEQVTAWWFRNVMNYGQTDQQADLSQLAESLSNLFGLTVTEVTQLAKDTPAMLTSSHFWSSGRGFIWLFALIFSAVVIWNMKFWMNSIRVFFSRLWRRRALNDFPLYDRWLLLLEKLHIDRQKHETPRELAARVSKTWQIIEPASSFADLPVKLIDSYYAVRYGKRQMDATELIELSNRLEHLHINRKIYFTTNGRK